MDSPQTIKPILDELSSIPEDKIASDPKVRKHAIKLGRRLTATLEPAVNRATDLMFAVGAATRLRYVRQANASQPLPTIAARIAIDLKLFDLLSASVAPVSTAKLAEQSGGELLLVQRLLRLLAAMAFVREDAEDLWSATDVTNAMAIPAISAGHRMVYDLIMSSGMLTPKYLRENGHISPSEPRDGIVQYAKQTKLATFEYISSQPSMLQDFNSFMGSTMGERTYWYDWYPAEERLLKDLDSSKPLLVDIGGGKGHDLQAFHTKFPNRGRLILQELPQALNDIQTGSLAPAIEQSVYDFFTEQPIKGARAYFFHHILHDWSDKYCLDILAKLRAAMTPGYSKLLIHDLVLPNSKASAYQCVWDINMMTFNAAIERSRKQWSDLLTKAGFNIVDFWVDDEEADGLIEAMVKT